MEQTPLLARSEALRSLSYGGNAERTTRTISPDERITYTWSDLNVFTSDDCATPRRNPFRKPAIAHKHILKNVTGVAHPGELLAIMGASGAGKTTLLDALTFQNPPNVVLTGVRCANGVSLTHATLTAQSAYVQQEDLFYPNLTVHEHLTFHAMVRMDRDIPTAQRRRRVADVIVELGLRRCERTAIAQLSGGERKRLAFAAAVLTDPRLLLCDEPTSGLDALMALGVVRVLSAAARAGRTVVATVHQPSSEMYALFDKVLLVADGRVAFLGGRSDAEAFFTSVHAPCPRHYNPADHYIALLAIVPGEEDAGRQAIELVCTAYTKSAFGERVRLAASNVTSKLELSYSNFWSVEPADHIYKNSWWTQFKAVLWRSCIVIMKEPLLIKVRLLQTIIISLLIGVMYYGQRLDQDGVMNINGVLFVFLTTMTFQNVYAVVQLFGDEFPVFGREHAAGMYRTDVYFVARTLAEAPLFTLLPALYVGACYHLVGLRGAPARFGIALGVLVLVAHAVLGFGYLIACATSSAAAALSVGPPLIIPFLLFGGFFLNVGSIPAYFKWLSYFSWFRYGYEALMINQWAGVDDITCAPDAPSCPRSGAVVLEMYNFAEENFTADIVMLLLLIVLFRTLAYICLLLRTLR